MRYGKALCSFGMGLLLLSGWSCEQHKEKKCHCPETAMLGTEIDTLFKLDNGLQLSLCGSHNAETGTAAFYEFTLSPCHQDTIVAKGGALMPSQIEVQGNTLQINRMAYLPTGRDYNRQNQMSNFLRR